MYIAIYNENKEHITNLANISYNQTTRVYDADTFSAEGVTTENIDKAKIAILNNALGDYKYACFVDDVTTENNKRKIKGLDFITLWDTDILIDYTVEGSFDGRLSAIFNKVKSLVFDGVDLFVGKIPVVVNIPTDNTDTTNIYGSYQGTYQIVNAYKFLKCYLKYYEYNIESRYDVTNGQIVFDFVKCTTSLSVNLRDFTHELTTSSTTTNKTVATIKFNPETPTTPRPPAIATIYYYRDTNNNIVQSDESGEIQNRIYPVVAKMFEAEHLADAQFSAVNELANARYVDNIIIDNNKLLDPIDFGNYPLYTKVSLYYDGGLYKVLPISEKTTTYDGNGESVKIKLGFKKVLLTEIIKKLEE